MESLAPFTAYYNRLYTSETGVQSHDGSFTRSPTYASSGTVLTADRPEGPFRLQVIHRTFPSLLPPEQHHCPLLSCRTAQCLADRDRHWRAYRFGQPVLSLLHAPGADDDASGTATILEAFRTLVQVGYEPLSGPVEFHWLRGRKGQSAIAIWARGFCSRRWFLFTYGHLQSMRYQGCKKEAMVCIHGRNFGVGSEKSCLRAMVNMLMASSMVCVV